MNNNTSLESLPATGRFSLRCKEQNIAVLSRALGLALPTKISLQVAANGRTALMLGPDEWVLSCECDDRPAIKEALAKVCESAPHSLTDISSRERSIRVKGREAAALLNTSCPRNLAELPSGRGVRTIFDSVQVILTREETDQYRLDIWCSFFPHVHALLSAANAEFKSGV
ncbi:Sarcosine oxidase, gamma subunit family [Pseudovibrio axinellae]|uniref:Sarcosine oxidase, gamma subunit family n=1 Tax=Pseudovibrio axinellae TaxID=989403 RepID=A0A165VTK3_9HYPH|nr:sarcosine oxidase subunit gamma family protein [Pseudovibrio axinellae]KZL15422.1 Sarcosine oxidase, gamma subunit family [Pseudovibrio axinellae]SER55791.1 sarcosine oxidase subunit gamma [Pseudovibrio axinellae]